MEEKYKNIYSRIYYKSVWQIKMGIERKQIILDSINFVNADLYLELALSGFPLPVIYATEDKFGNLHIISGANIINALIKYASNKKNIEKDRARVEDTKLEIIAIEYCAENNTRINEIKELLKKIKIAEVLENDNK